MASLHLLTVREVAERLRSSASLVYELVNQGKLGCHRIGTGRGSIRVSEHDLADYLDSCKQATKVAKPRPTGRPGLKHLRL